MKLVKNKVWFFEDIEDSDILIHNCISSRLYNYIARSYDYPETSKIWLKVKDHTLNDIFSPLGWSSKWWFN